MYPKHMAHDVKLGKMPFNCFREAPIVQNWPGAVFWGLKKVERRPGVRNSDLSGPRGRAGRRRSRRSLVVAVVLLLGGGGHMWRLAVARQLELVL